jgi:hypothetical protein
MRKRSNVLRREIAIARRIWGRISQAALDSLAHQVERFGVSVSSGDVQFLDGRCVNRRLQRLPHFSADPIRTRSRVLRAAPVRRRDFVSLKVLP